MLLLALLALAVVPAWSTVLVPADLTDLSAEARTIVHGWISEVSPRAVDGGRQIETVVTLRPIDWLKGDVAPHITFRVPGGRVGRYRNIWIGAPVFEPGEEVVLFLGRHDGYGAYVLGLGQGVFRVATDPASGRRLVWPPPLLRPEDAPEPVVRGDPTRHPAPLGIFVGHVREILAASQTSGLAR